MNLYAGGIPDCASRILVDGYVDYTVLDMVRYIENR